MWPMYDHPGLALYGLIYLVVIVVSLIALWRAMRAHEAIATHLDTIAGSLSPSREPPK